MTKLKTKTKRTAKAVEELPETIEDLPFVPPDLRYLSERYVVRIPADDPHFESRWQLRVYAEKSLERRLGDTVQLTSMRVRRPHLLAKGKARILRRQPMARLLVTVKF